MALTKAILWSDGCAAQFRSRFALNPIQDGLFGGCSWMGERGGGKKIPLPKICHTYPTMTKIGTVIPVFYWHQYFLTGNQ